MEGGRRVAGRRAAGKASARAHVGATPRPHHPPPPTAMAHPPDDPPVRLVPRISWRSSLPVDDELDAYLKPGELAICMVVDESNAAG